MLYCRMMLPGIRLRFQRSAFHTSGNIRSINASGPGADIGDELTAAVAAVASELVVVEILATRLEIVAAACIVRAR